MKNITDTLKYLLMFLFAIISFLGVYGLMREGRMLLEIKEKILNGIYLPNQKVPLSMEEWAFTFICLIFIFLFIAFFCYLIYRVTFSIIELAKKDGDNEDKGKREKDGDKKAQSPLDQFAIVPFYPTRNLLFAAILSICASSSKKISIYNEEMIVARCFIGFIIFSRKSLGKTFKMTLDGRIQAIQEESQQFPNPNEVVPPESNEQQRLLRISLRICGTVVESLPMARCAPKCEKTVQAFLCRNLNVKSATLPNATSSRRIRLQDDLVTAFHLSVSERFVPGSTLKVSIVELIQEGLGVLKRGGSLNK